MCGLKGACDKLYLLLISQASLWDVRDNLILLALYETTASLIDHTFAVDKMVTSLFSFVFFSSLLYKLKISEVDFYLRSLDLILHK